MHDRSENQFWASFKARPSHFVEEFVSLSDLAGQKNVCFVWHGLVFYVGGAYSLVAMVGSDPP